MLVKLMCKKVLMVYWCICFVSYYEAIEISEWKHPPLSLLSQIEVISLTLRWVPTCFLLEGSGDILMPLPDPCWESFLDVSVYGSGNLSQAYCHLLSCLVIYIFSSTAFLWKTLWIIAVTCPRVSRSTFWFEMPYSTSFAKFPMYHIVLGFVVLGIFGESLFHQPEHIWGLLGEANGMLPLWGSGQEMDGYSRKVIKRT